MPIHPDTLHPLPDHPRLVFLKNCISRPGIEVGDYTYYDDPDGPERFEVHNVLYHFPFIGDRLIIGKFCAIAAGAKFIMNGGNHRLDGFATYPFAIFGAEFATAESPEWPYRGDTTVGHDVWIGYDATIMPGVAVGTGAVVAAKAVVTKNVEPYAIVAGNPARPVRRRVDAATAETLLQIAWWDWPIDRIARHAAAICGHDLPALQQVAGMP